MRSFPPGTAGDTTEVFSMIRNPFRNLRAVRDDAAGEQGSAMVEFAVMTPFLAFLVLSIIEFGMLMDQYLHVVNIARDSARLAVQIVNHEANQTCTVTYGSPCPQVNASIAHQRAWYLLQELAPDLDLGAAGDPQLQTRSTLFVDGSGTGGDQTIDFSIIGEFESLNGLRIPINVHATGGYRVVGAGGGGGGGGGGGYSQGYDQIREGWELIFDHQQFIPGP